MRESTLPASQPSATMVFMPDQALTQAVWTALSTTHRPLALLHGQARRYPAAIAPFAAIESPSAAALGDLRQLLSPGETVFLQGARPPDIPGLLWGGVIPCLQMIFPAAAELPRCDPTIPIESLDCSHATEMMDLITLAYPGYFRPETCRMGRYFGVRDAGIHSAGIRDAGIHSVKGRLVAMGGERLCLDPWHEISGVCTHPDYTGGGFGTAILRQLLGLHRDAALRSWLWVTETNYKAIDLYLRLGFEVVHRSEHGRITRVAD